MREWASLEGGAHTVPLADETRFSPGVCGVRLTLAIRHRRDERRNSLALISNLSRPVGQSFRNSAVSPCAPGLPRENPPGPADPTTV
jgi:hypothetical protein